MSREVCVHISAGNQYFYSARRCAMLFDSACCQDIHYSYLMESKEEDRNRDILGRWVHGMRVELQATGSLALYVHPMHI